MTDRLITADARKVSGLAFFDAITGSSPELREQQRQNAYERCIRAIQRGDTYGFPPSMVSYCCGIIAEREQLTETQSDPLLNTKRAA